MRKEQNLKLFREIRKCLLIHHNLMGYPEGFTNHTLTYLDKFHHRMINSDLDQAVKGNKAVRLAFTKACCEDKGGMETFPLKLSKMSRMPKALTHFGTYLDSGEYRKEILTMLTAPRSYLGDRNNVDLTSITEGGSNVELANRLLEAHIPDFLRSLGVNKPISISGNGEFTISSRQGPNGHAMRSLYSDVQLLTAKQVEDLGTLGGPIFLDSIKENISLIENRSNGNKFIESFKILPQKGVSLAKLSTISDSELKTRVIAIGNYWFQNALKPLHDIEMNLLRKLRSDCTHNQSQFKRVLNKNEGHSYGSIDLTAATDRFPISTQAMLLSRLISKPYSEAGVNIIRTPLLWKGAEVKYSVGQPMGFYSSGATFALTHHLVVHAACTMAGVKPKGNYALLGDDIVISHDQVATNYKIILGFLGVEANASKTHVSKHCFEFAKRGYSDDTEGSPFPIRATVNANNTTDILQALYTSAEKGGNYPHTTEYSCSFGMSAKKGNSHPKYLTHCYKLALMNHLVIQGSLMKCSGENVFKGLIEVFELDNLNEVIGSAPEIIEIVFRINVVNGGLTKIFNSKSLVDGGALGGIIPTNVISPIREGDSDPRLIPHASTCRSIVTQYITEVTITDFVERLKDLVTRNKRSVLIKDLTEIYVSRSQKLDGTSVTTFAKRLTTMLKHLSKSQIQKGNQFVLSTEILQQVTKSCINDFGVISFVKEIFPKHKDQFDVIMKDYVERKTGEPMDQEDGEGVLDEASGLSPDKSCIRGMKVKPDGNLDFYILHRQDLVSKRRALVSPDVYRKSYLGKYQSESGEGIQGLLT